MLFSHNNSQRTTGVFRFSGDVTAKAHPACTEPVLSEFWHGFTYRTSNLTVVPCEDLIFQIGQVKAPCLDGNAYAISISESGVCVRAAGKKELLWGYLTLLDSIEMDNDGALYLTCGEMKESPSVKRRMVHFCVFHETELWEFHKFVRLCGALKYTHLLIEFWGMYKFDCLDALSWENGFTKEQLKPIIDEAHALGMEIVPFFNHWGHATGSRAIHGKHVVLDQAPWLQSLYTDEGWCWNYKNSSTLDLLKQVRHELIELCGPGEYFHIGCDEAHSFDFSDENMRSIIHYLNSVSEELAACGRKTIVWGDMFLTKRSEYTSENFYYMNAPSIEKADYMLSILNPQIIIADWQYDAKTAPVETALTISAAGHAVMLCTWDRGDAVGDACISTIRNNNLYGLIHTTWHTLTDGMSQVSRMAALCWQSEKQSEYAWQYHFATAAMMRKISFVNGDYRTAGWGYYDVGVLTT